jgi:subtilisin family serine protease
MRLPHWPHRFPRGLLAISLALAIGSATHGQESAPTQRAARTLGDPVDAVLFLSERCDLDALSAELDAQHASRARRHEVVVRTLQALATRSQQDLVHHLTDLRDAGRIESFTPLWITNAIVIRASGAELARLARRPGIARVRAATREAPVEPGWPTPDPEDQRGGNPPSPGLVVIHAPEVWAQGITGEGTLVCSLDTGVNGEHPALASRWRGLDPAYDGHPSWAWFDPATGTTHPMAFINHHALDSHGTLTMGILCGGAPGDPIGVAPGAQWISAAVINRDDTDVVALALQAYQWAIDPDGDPATIRDVPDVCSNSWGQRPSCDDSLWSVHDALEAGGTVVVFSGGNNGLEGPGTPASRATEDFRTFAVGALNGRPGDLEVWSGSSRGPSTCTVDGSPAIKPEIAAPGVNVRSASAFQNGYVAQTGTSFAAPHVGGTIALMRQVNPYLTVRQIKRILVDTAFDLGAPGPDNEYGHGMLDALAAVERAGQLLVHVPSEEPTLAQALAQAPDGATILLADGHYTGPQSRGLQPQGRVAIVSENGPANCVLDCEERDVGFRIAGAETDVLLEGLTIRRGRGPAVPDPHRGFGGGVTVCDGASATLRNCRIQDCSATALGGGVGFDGGRSLLIERCDLQGNRVGFARAFGRGGGVGVRAGDATTSIRIVDSVIAANSSVREGGGVTIDNDRGSSSLAFELRGCTLARNRVTGGLPGVPGGGVFLIESRAGQASWSVLDCVLWDNAVEASGGLDAPGNQLAFARGSNGTRIAYSNVQGGPEGVPHLDAAHQWGPGNLDADPLFVDPLTDYHLSALSPCVDAGDPDFDPARGELDIDGEPRRLGSRVDMGADERADG